ncbi:MAG TPA: phosphatase PAP2 family protein [Thermoanaerobaculia bacterium]|nr:phosphatase PAP2 family protein [Thermoanaerobaculia bacterium]
MLVSLTHSLDATEIALVARIAAASDRHGLTRIAKIATRLGNGSLYPLLILFLIAVRVEDAIRFAFSAAVSLAVAHILYPLLKRSIGRLRPCDYDPSLARDIEPMDHYSCPSGHAMTAAAFGVPLAMTHLPAALLALAIWAAISWSRVALGHHYVSDVVAGTILGAGVAGTVLVWIA